LPSLASLGSPSLASRSDLLLEDDRVQGYHLSLTPAKQDGFGTPTSRALRLPNAAESFFGRSSPTGATHYLCLDPVEGYGLLAFA
jgi:hypothetical protein